MAESTAPQAEPAEGRAFPAKARGARPTYFDDDGATDAVLAIVTSLSAEVWALRERLATIEALLESSGTVDENAVDGYRPDASEGAARSEEAAAFTSRVFRVFEEMREEAVAGETQEQYGAVVQRAFDEI